MLGRILAHELMEEEANEVKNLAKQSSTSKNKEIAFKVSKNKLKEESSSSEDESSEHEEMAFFVKKFTKKEGFNKYKRDMPKRRTSKRAFYECCEVGHFIADCPNKKKGNDKEEKKGKPFKKDKYKTHKKKYSGQAHISE